jgi:hypothetical protein
MNVSTARMLSCPATGKPHQNGMDVEYGGGDPGAAR